MTEPPFQVRRRDLLSLIGVAAGSAAMYQAMTGLGFAHSSDYGGPIKLEGDARGATVLVLGAGLAGMTAALELRQAGYDVRILEYNNRAGGRNWTLRGGDRYTELGGATQDCAFDAGLYLNPGPWRIPYHHNAILDYCRRLGVALEPFTQLNYNAFLHSQDAFDGKPQRIRALKADFQGHIAELLAKTTAQERLDAPVTAEDQEILLAALRQWGALDKDYTYRRGLASAGTRGYEKDPGGGLSALPVPSDPMPLPDLLRSGLWEAFANFSMYEFQTTLMQPVGGMGMVGQAFAAKVGDLITYNAKVTRIQQSRAGADRLGRLVRLHHSPVDPEPDPDRRRRQDASRDHGRTLRRLGQDRPAVPSPVLGGGRSDLWRHQLHRPAHPHHRLSPARLSRPQGRAARRLHVRHERLRVHRHGAG
jgi:monoamine oxidase